jgi:hypothetical protein
METRSWRHGQGDMDKETWTWRHGHGHGILSNQTEKGRPGDFHRPFTVCSSCKRKLVVNPFVLTKKQAEIPLAYRLNGLAHL